MWCDKIGAVIFKAFYFIGKFLGLVPLDYDFAKKVFVSSVPATLVSSVICICVVILSPLVVKLYWDMYFISGVDIDENMSLITVVQIGFIFVTSFVVLLCQVWKRKPVSRSANTFQEVFNSLTAEMGCGSFITLEMLFLIAMKLCITMYEVVINFPYLFEHGHNIPPEGFVAFFLNLYVAEITAVYADIIFTALLLLSRYFHLVDGLLQSVKTEIQAGEVTEKQIRQWRRRLRRLKGLYVRMKGMVGEISGCVEIPVFVLILHSFANMLTNLYAVLEFYAIERNLEMKDLVYNVMIFLNICLLIHAAERVRKSSADLKDTLLDLDASCGDNRSKWRSDVLVFEVWPEEFEVDVLGMFSLNNTFLLFLLAYASNFVVIILQFELTRACFLSYVLSKAK